MAVNVCFSFITDTQSRLVVGTYPAATGLHTFLWGSDKPNLAAGMIESWDFDRDAGVLRVASAPGSSTADQQVPLESITRLTWCGRERGGISGEYSDYDVTLCFEDGGSNRVLSLPGPSDHYRCVSLDQVREVEARLRAFLKPLCPRLETTALEDLGTFLLNPVEGLASIQGKMGRLLADMERTAGRPEASRTAAPDGQEAIPAHDPHAPVRELVAQAHAALGRVREAAAQNPKLGGSPDHVPGLLLARSIFFILCMVASAVIAFWFLRS